MFGGNPNVGLGDYIQNCSSNAENQPQHLNPSQSSMTVDYRYMKPIYLQEQQQQAPYPTNNSHQQQQGYDYAQGGIPSSSALPFNNEHYPPDHHYNGNSIALNHQANIGPWPYTTSTLVNYTMPADDYSLETPPSQQLYTDNQEPPNQHQQYLHLQPSFGDNLVGPFLSETERASADIMNAYAYPNEQMERQETMQESHSNQQDLAIDFYMDFNQQQFERCQEFQTNSINQEISVPNQLTRLETVPLIANSAGGDYIDLSPPSESEIHTNSSYSHDEMESDLVNSVLNYQAEDHSQCQTFSQEQQQNSIPSNGSENVQNFLSSTSDTFESNNMAKSSTGLLTSSTVNSTPNCSLFGFVIERDIDEGSVSTRTSAEEISQELGTQPNNNEMMPEMEVHSVNKIRNMRCKELKGKKCAQQQQQKQQKKFWNVLNWYRKRPKLMKGNCNENGELNDSGAPTTSAMAYGGTDDRMSTSSHRVEPIEMPAAADDQTDNDPINELKKEHVKLEEWINNQTKQSIGPEWNIDQQMKIFDGILKRCTELKTKVNDSHPEIEKLLKWDYENCIFLYQPNPWMYGKPKPVEKENKKGETNKIEAKCKHTCYETEIFPFWHRIFDFESVSLNGDCQVIALLNEDKASQIQNSDKIEVSPCKCEISKYMKCRIEIINPRGICKIKSEIIRDKDENAAMINEKETIAGKQQNDQPANNEANENAGATKKNKQKIPKTRGNDTRYCLQFNLQIDGEIRTQRTASFTVQDTVPNDVNLLFKIYATRFFEKISGINNYEMLSTKKLVWSDVAEFLELFAQILKHNKNDNVEPKNKTVQKPKQKKDKVKQKNKHDKLAQTFIDAFIFILNILRDEKMTVNFLWKSRLICFCDRDTALDMLEKRASSMVVRFPQTFFGSLEILVSPAELPMDNCREYKKGCTRYVKLNQSTRLHFILNNKLEPILPWLKKGTILRLLLPDMEESKIIEQEREKYVHVRTLEEPVQYGYLKACYLLKIQNADTFLPIHWNCTNKMASPDWTIMKRIESVDHICGPLDKIVKKEELLEGIKENFDGMQEIEEKFKGTYLDICRNNPFNFKK